MLTNKIALVTGGSTGIGAATTRLFALNGARVFVASHLPEAELQVFCEEIGAAGGAAIGVRCDVTDRAAVAHLIGRIRSDHGRMDIVVNSAGLFVRTPIFELDLAQVDRLFAVNVMGPINVMHAVLPLMRQNGGGSIINIASAAAKLGTETCSAYAASKAALVQFTQTLAPELRRSGIRVNCIAPGSVRTPMLGFGGGPLSPDQLASIARREAATNSPYGEAMSDPKDIAQVALFLASDASHAIQGACITVDQSQTAAMPIAP